MSAGSVPGPRVLLSAYQCGPGMGSVSQIGWEWYSRLAQRVPVTLVTHVRNRVALATHGAPFPGTTIQYIDTEWFAKPLYRLSRAVFPGNEHSGFLLSSLDFFAYDYVAVRSLRKQLRAGSAWDVVHSVTPVSPSAAGSLHKLGMPVVLGPWNGGLKSPKHFDRLMASEYGWFNNVRDAGLLLDRLRGTTAHAAKILVANPTTEQRVPQKSRAKCVRMSENGVSLSTFAVAPWPAAPSRHSPLHVIYVGRLLPAKGVPMLIDAVAKANRTQYVRLTIIGDGPDMEQCRTSVQSQNLQSLVEFRGAQPLAAIAKALGEAHVLCLPSVRESGGAVLLEAMACARPVIAIAYGGPGQIVDDEVGRAIPLGTEESVTTDLTKALLDVAANPDEWRRRGEAGRLRIEQTFDWDKRVADCIELYRTLATRRHAANLSYDRAVAGQGAGR